MWDFLKKAAGSVATAGLKYLTQKAAVDHIMQSPDIESGKIALRKHINTLDDESDYRMFLSVVSQSYDQAAEQAQKPRHDQSWGNTTEDRVAYRMAMIRSGQTMNDPEAERLVEIYALMHKLAQEYWAERSAQPAPPANFAQVSDRTPSGPSPDPPPDQPQNERASRVRHYLDQIEDLFPKDESNTISYPETGLLSLVQAYALDQEASSLTMSAMARAQPFLVNEDVLANLDLAYAKQQRLIKDAPKGPDGFDIDKLYPDMLVTLQTAARACEALPREGDDKANFVRALGYLERISDFPAGALPEEKLRAVKRNMHDLRSKIGGQGNVMPDYLDDPAELPLDEAHRLIDKASYVGMNDQKGALDLLIMSEKLLADNQLFPPTGDEMVQSLAEIVSDPDSGGAAASEMVKLRAAYKSLYLQFIRLFGKSNPGDPDFVADQQKVAAYTHKLEEIDSREIGDALRQGMMGLFGTEKFDDPT